MSAEVSGQRRSVPAPRHRPPRSLDLAELETAGRIGDVLCWSERHDVVRPSESPEFKATLHVALAARRDAFDDVVSVLHAAESVRELAPWLRALAESSPVTFASVSTVVAGAYLMVSEVKAFVGYPGQGRNPAPPSQIGDELADGILDPVIERAPIYRTP